MSDQRRILSRQMNKIPRPESGVPALLETAVRLVRSFRLEIACSKVSVYAVSPMRTEGKRDTDLERRLSRSRRRARRHRI